jgi:hypothetical protein
MSHNDVKFSLPFDKPHRWHAVTKVASVHGGGGEAKDATPTTDVAMRYQVKRNLEVLTGLETV